MRRSMVILTTVISLVLCMALIGFGVYANISQTYSITNTIGFNPSPDVYVALECKVTGSKQTEIDTPPEGYASKEEYLEDKGLVQNFDFDESMRGQEGYSIPDWKIDESLEFINHTTSIMYIIKVYNYSDREIEVSIEEYVKDSEYITNVVPNKVKIAGYQRGEQPSSATIVLETKVSQYDSSFTKENNDFTVAFTATPDD